MKFTVVLNGNDLSLLEDGKTSCYEIPKQAKYAELKLILISYDDKGRVIKFERPIELHASVDDFCCHDDHPGIAGYECDCSRKCGLRTCDSCVD